MLRSFVLAAACLLVGAAPAAADSVLVKFRDSADRADRAAALRAVDAVRTGSVRALDVQVLQVADATSAVRALDGLATVEYAERNLTLRTQATPNDPRFADLWGLDNTGQTGGTADADIDAPEGWSLAGMDAFPSSGGALVGIVDTGIRASHEDLGGKVAHCAESRGLLGLLGGSIREGSCADDNGHGTHVAGTVSANANNGRGVAGVGFDSPLAICRALGGILGSGSTSDVANCITWLADKGAKVISMSLGGGDSRTLHDAVKYAWKSGNGALLVAAAGNDGDSTVNYPAGYAEVVSVAATDHRDARASFSNANSDVEIAAPGVDVLSTYNGSDASYTELSGTSMATPHVAGVAAIIAGGGGSASTWRSQLAAAVDDLGPAGRDASFGYGRVNLAKAFGG